LAVDRVGAPVTRADEVPLFGPRNGALRRVHLEAHAPFDESYDARHHALPRVFATDVDVAVVRVTHESMSAPRELAIEFVEYDVAEKWGKWASLRYPLLRAHHHAIRHHDVRFEHPANENEPRSIAQSLCETRHQSLAIHPIEEFLQIEIHHPLVTRLHMSLRFGDRRMATSTRSKPVALRVKRRLIQGFEHHPYGFLHHAVDHVWNAEPALTSARLRNPYAPDISGHVRPRTQRGAQDLQRLVEMLAHLVDALTVGTWRSLVRRYLSKRSSQTVANCTHHRRRGALFSALTSSTALCRRTVATGPTGEAGATSLRGARRTPRLASLLLVTGIAAASPPSPLLSRCRCLTATISRNSDRLPAVTSRASSRRCRRGSIGSSLSTTRAPT